MNELAKKTIKPLTVLTGVSAVVSLLLGSADIAVGVAAGALLFVSMLRFRIWGLKRFADEHSIPLPVKHSLIRHGVVLLVLCIVATLFGLVTAVVVVVMQVVGNVLLVVSALRESCVESE